MGLVLWVQCLESRDYGICLNMPQGGGPSNGFDRPSTLMKSEVPKQRPERQAPQSGSLNLKVGLMTPLTRVCIWKQC